jgi:hypothetical protein
MSKGLAPLTYRQQALMIGYLTLGEGFPFIAVELDRSVLAVELAYNNIISTLQNEGRIAADISCAIPPEKTEKPKTKDKWKPRKFRVLGSAVRRAQRSPIDVTANLMNDPAFAEFERSLKRPPAFREEPRYGKRIF